MNNEPNYATPVLAGLAEVWLMITNFDFNFTEQDTEITITNKNGHLVLSNGCRIKLIDGREVLPIKEKFKINKRVKLVNALNQKQINQLWFSYQHDPSLMDN